MTSGSTASISWNIKNCTLYRHFHKENMLEMDITAPAGGAGYRDGGGAGYRDGGSCADAPRGARVEDTLGAIPGFYELNGSPGRKNLLAYRTGEKMSRHSREKTAYFLATPQTLSMLSENLLKTYEKLYVLDLLEMLKSKVAMYNGRSFSTPGVGGQFSSVSETYICPQRTISRKPPQRINAAPIVAVNGTVITFNLVFEGCAEKEQLAFSIDSAEFGQGPQAYQLGRWLILQVESKSGRKFYVDLRNFWFSHPNVPLGQAVIQVKPVPRDHSFRDLWWAHYTLVFD